MRGGEEGNSNDSICQSVVSVCLTEFRLVMKDSGELH